MTWRLDLLDDTCVVRVTTSGRVTAEVGLRVARELVRTLELTGYRRFLVDHRYSEMAITITELYYLATNTLALGLDQRFVGAVVFNPATEHDFEFYQMRLNTVGLPRRMFTDYEEALRWLTNGQARTRHQ